MAEDSFHNKIASICLKHFESLPKKGKPKNNEWTILSCIVVENNSDYAVVALGTGSKCIGENKLSARGDVINDSHAEIMCRRSFLFYLYEQINLAPSTKSKIFQYNFSNKNISLNENVKFHFFTTHVPCGDAAIFPKQKAEEFGTVINDDKTKITNKRHTGGFADLEIKKRKLEDDIHRTGAKCLQEDEKQDLKLEGGAYHVLGAVRRKPGRGDPTLSVSCSDKMARWCHLGIQGSLIFFLLNQPIYLSSFTIIEDTPFSREALERALYTRIGEIQLEAPFRQNKLTIGQSSLKFNFAKTDSKVPCPSSISWIKTKESMLMEVAVEGKKQGVTKKNINTDSARLNICKINLFKNFIATLNNLEITVDVEDLNGLSYKSAKRLSQNYIKSSNAFKGNLKVWTQKPDCLLNFNTE